MKIAISSLFVLAGAHVVANDSPPRAIDYRFSSTYSDKVTSRKAKPYASETAVGTLSGRTPVIVYNAADGHFYQIKEPPAKKSKLFSILKDASQRTLLADDVSASLDSKVTIIVVNVNTTIFDAKTDLKDIKLEVEKVPDLLKQVFGDIPGKAAGGANDTPQDQIKAFTNELKPENKPKDFVTALDRINKVLKIVKNQCNGYVELVDDLLDKSTQYEDFKKSLEEPPFTAEERKTLEEALKQNLHFLELYYETEMSGDKPIKEQPLIQQAKYGVDQNATKATASLKSYDAAVLIYFKTKGSSDLGIEEDTFFGEAFVASAPDPKTVEGGGFTASISITPKKKDGGLQAQQKQFTVKPQSEAITFTFSTGLSFLRANDISVGKADTADPNVKTIVLKGNQGSQIGVTTAYVHTLLPNNGFKWGPTFGIGKRDESMAYFAGLTAAFGGKQQLLLTAGYGWVPTRVLDGVDLGDSIGSSTTIPTKMVNRGAFFVGFSYKF